MTVEPNKVNLALARELASLHSITGDDPALVAYLHAAYMTSPFINVHGLYVRSAAWWSEASDSQRYAAWTRIGLTDSKEEDLRPEDTYAVPNCVVADLGNLVELTQQTLATGPEPKVRVSGNA